MLHTLHDIFDVLTGETEPVMTPSFVVVAAIRMLKSEEGQHHFSFLVKDKNGKHLIAPENHHINAQKIKGISGLFWFENQIPSAPLGFGEYFFSIEQYGEQLSEIRLQILPSLPSFGLN
jgi:hypothetical protein